MASIVTKGVFETKKNLQRAPVEGGTSQVGDRKSIESTVLRFRLYVKEFDFRRPSALSSTLDRCLALEKASCTTLAYKMAA
jgi:hypothetical protein